MLLETTSSSRCSAVCHDRAIRRIVQHRICSPSRCGCRPPRRDHSTEPRALPSRASIKAMQRPCQIGNICNFIYLYEFGGSLARQETPVWSRHWAKNSALRHGRKLPLTIPYVLFAHAMAGLLPRHVVCALAASWLLQFDRIEVANKMALAAKAKAKVKEPEVEPEEEEDAKAEGEAGGEQPQRKLFGLLPLKLAIIAGAATIHPLRGRGSGLFLSVRA